MSKEPGVGHNVGGVAADRLRSLIERIERLEEERKAVGSDIKDIYTEAKSAGFDTKVVRQVVRLRQRDPADVEEEETLLDVYRAALGMLNGEGLSGRARKRLSGEDEPSPPAEPRSGDTPAEASPSGDSGPDQESEPVCKDLDAALVEQAREQGAQAATGGQKVTANPWPFGDPRRASWDEGWCARAGSDGMEIPDAWRRRKKATPEPEAA